MEAHKKYLILWIISLFLLTGCRTVSPLGAGLIGASFKNWADSRDNEKKIEELEQQLADLKNLSSEFPDYRITINSVICKNATIQKDEMVEDRITKTCIWPNLQNYREFSSCTVKMTFTMIYGQPGVKVEEEITPHKFKKDSLDFYLNGP